MTSEPSLLVNLGSSSAADAFQESPRPGVTGTLPVERGGTGASSYNQAWSNLKVVGVSGDATAGLLQCDESYDQRVMTSVVGKNGSYMTVAADAYFGLYDNNAKSWVWQKLLSGMSQNGLDAYPIGAVYISYVSTSPASLFGGTWTPITGRFPYFNAGTGTGGSNTHTHSLTNGFAKFFMGQESAGDFSFLSSIKTGSWSGNGRLLRLVSGEGDWWVSSDGSISTHTTGMGLGGNSDSASTMPSYQTLYAWRRTA